MVANSRAKYMRKYRHGLSTMKRALALLGTRRLDMRFSANKALLRWRDDLISDLGGRDEVSVQQEAIIELACRTKFMLDSIDNWLLSQPALVNSHKKALLPAVRERQSLADGLARYLAQLGLRRQARAATISDLLNRDGDESDKSDQSATNGSEA